MARITKDVTISKLDGTDPVTYKLMQCGALEGRKGTVRLLKLLAAGISGATQADGEGDGVQLAKGVAGMVDKLREEDMEYFCELLSKHTMVNNQMLTGVFDEHFAGNPVGMLQWLVAAQEHNFGSFLSEAGVIGRLSELQAKLQTASPK